ncbi:NAD(P)/FAD-dependent oxidoreductase [soil metagenome]
MGGGIGGLAAAALIGAAGHETTLLEGSSYLGGKSRRISLDGQRIDTGPSLFTFPGVWEEFLRRWDASGGRTSASEIAGLDLRRMPEVGTYHYRGESVSLPVPPGHAWHEAWKRFCGIHGGLEPDVTQLLTADPLDRRTLPALRRLLRTYGTKLTTRGYLDGLTWLPAGLREIIAIHTLNAGVSPSRTPALYASMPAIMATDGVWAPEGGVYEVVLSLEKLARHAGVEIKTEEPALKVTRGEVSTSNSAYSADAVVSGLDTVRLEDLVEPAKKARAHNLSCSGVAVYATLRDELDIPQHSVVLPSDPGALYKSLESGTEPAEAMAFANYYAPGDIYPNEKATLGLLLTAPPNGKEYGLDDDFVEREIARVSQKLGLDESATNYFMDHQVFHPRYFGAWGSAGGALYGAARPFWQSGPLHRPRYSDRRRPWLWRVGASVHPGGGIPAVLAGAMISTNRLLSKLKRS